MVFRSCLKPWVTFPFRHRPAQSAVVDGCFWRWPENDSSVSFYDVPLCENNDSKSQFQSQSGFQRRFGTGPCLRKDVYEMAHILSTGQIRMY